MRERLGTGGMGIVFRVEHVHTGRTYALKVLRPTLAATPEGQRRFEAEARAIGALRHPNVVDVVDFGYAGMGAAMFPYLVMERLEGFPLSQTLVGGAGLPWPWVTSVLEQIGAVDGAHAAGIVHGDLKPENVWLTPRTAGGFDVKVLDFGLARAGADDATSVGLRDATPTARGEHTTVLPWTTTPAGDRSSPMRALPGPPHTCRPSGCAARASQPLPTCTFSACSPTASSPVGCRRPTRRHRPVENGWLPRDQTSPATRSTR